jgi:hypothetical protein
MGGKTNAFFIAVLAALTIGYAVKRYQTPDAQSKMELFSEARAELRGGFFDVALGTMHEMEEYGPLTERFAAFKDTIYYQGIERTLQEMKENVEEGWFLHFFYNFDMITRYADKAQPLPDEAKKNLEEMGVIVESIKPFLASNFLRKAEAHAQLDEPLWFAAENCLEDAIRASKELNSPVDTLELEIAKKTIYRAMFEIYLDLAEYHHETYDDIKASMSLDNARKYVQLAEVDSSRLKRLEGILSN